MSVALGHRAIRQSRPTNPHIDQRLLLKTHGGNNPFKYETRGDGQFYASLNPTKGGSLILGNDPKTNTPMEEMELSSKKGGNMSGGNNDDNKPHLIEQSILKAVHKVLSKKANHKKLNEGVEPEEYAKMLGKGWAKSVYRKHIYPKLKGEEYTYNLGSAKGKKEFEEDHKLGVVDKMILKGLKWGWGKLKDHLKKRREGARGGSFVLTEEGHKNLLDHEEGGSKVGDFFKGVWKGIKEGAKILPAVAPFIL